ncbi:speckle-type POZ protein-like isoform X1 [Planococcus citri]|uniref:speckle-type POZ protein-like isoform X1 n=1 Tax=Planococcus citri TaxID=170843 RepID=UPI0031FA0C7B
MNPFYISWIVLFAPYCISQIEPSKLALNIDSGNLTRSQTHWQTHEIKHIWTINQFSLHEELNTSKILTPKLRASTTDKYEWYAEIKPNEIYNGGKTIALWIYLSEGSTVTEVLAMNNVSIINHRKEVSFYKQTPVSRNFKLGTEARGWGWKSFCPKDDFFRNQLLQNDTLILFIYIKWITESSNNLSHQLEISSASPTPTPDTTAIKCDLSEDFESLLEDPKCADVIFTTNGSNYPAHKYILAARSPFFAAMFRRKDSKDGKLRKIRINVTHMDEEVLRAMLRYIYTGKYENLGKLADKLFVAAAKYGLEGLKKICERTLCETLTAENADDMFVFAKKHHANELKSKVIEFLWSRSAQKLNKTD